jgi:hypothetical protein
MKDDGRLCGICVIALTLVLHGAIDTPFLLYLVYIPSCMYITTNVNQLTIYHSRSRFNDIKFRDGDCRVYLY